MKFYKSLFLLYSIVSAYSLVTAQSSLDVVKIKSGLISGTASNGIHIFKGIPFAAPPILDLRWKAPQPVKPWSGTLACTKFGPSPMQNDPKPFRMWSQEFMAPAESLSEDCLYLNVWTSAKSPSDKLPVLVWIYGGAFASGSGACPIYDGEGIAKEGIVYVTINYRVNVFGFLAHSELTAESPTKSSGNYGLMDQIAALKWVNENISAFGGDPNKVTIAGQSAGSFSVQALVASPLTKGLFRGAIAQSGAMTGRPSVALADAEQTGKKLSDKINAKSISALRALSADSILKLANTLPFGSFFPIIDGYVLPTDVRKIFETGKHNDIAIMLGWVMGDADLAMGSPQSAEKFREMATATYGEKVDEFNQLLPSATDDELKRSQGKLALLRFAGFPDYEWANWNKHNSFLYQFSYVPTDKPGFPNYGAFHTSEVPFALHSLSKWDRPWKDIDYVVEKFMTSYWVNFVKSGYPNGNGLPEWKPFDKAQGNIMELGEQPVLKQDIFKKEFSFMESAQSRK